MSLTQWITDGLHQYAYQPEIVYLLVIAIMLLASFGLPVPEEVVIITTSLLAFMALHPEDYPPPQPGARGINVYALMIVCFLAVFLSDFLVFQIGRRLGRGLPDRKWFKKIINPKTYKKVKFWTQKYGTAAPGLFRFLPGLRFPGHMACGALGISPWKFAAVDLVVVLLTIPTQVYLIAHYGEEILLFLNKFKYVLILLVLAVAGYIFWSIYSNVRYLKTKELVRSKNKKIKFKDDLQ